MNMRRLFIVIIIVVILLTAAAVLISYLTRSKDTNTNDGRINTNGPAVANTNTFVNSSTATANRSSDQAVVLSLARTFAERYGSWSPESVGRFAAELRSWVTDDFAQRLSSPSETSDVRSMVSRTLSTTLRSWDAGERGVVEVTLSRTKTGSSGQTVEYYETLSVTTINQNGQWLVDRADWQAARVQPGGGGA